MADVNPVLNNVEIRLIILSAYYNALKTGKNPLQGKIPRLEQTNYQTINWHFIWMIEHEYLNGTITSTTGAGHIASVNRISRKGIDLIEKITENEVNDPNSQLLTRVDKNSTLQEKSGKFSEFILEGMKFTNNILSLANKLSCG